MEVEDSILSMAASGSPLYTLLAGQVCVMTGVGAQDVCCDLADLYRGCVQVAEKQLGENTSLEACLSLIALATSVGGPLYDRELDAMLEGNMDDPGGSGSNGRVQAAQLEKTVLGCFIYISTDGFVTLCHDVIAAETCNMFDLLPACPTEIPPCGSKATALHAALGSAFHSQLLGAVSELKGAATPAAQVASKVRVVRAAEMAVTHLYILSRKRVSGRHHFDITGTICSYYAHVSRVCYGRRVCAGAWREALQCFDAFVGIRPLHTALTALTLTLGDLSSTIEGAADGLQEAKAKAHPQDPSPRAHTTEPLSLEA